MGARPGPEASPPGFATVGDLPAKLRAFIFVPIDRAATLRNAEKLVRQGKLQAAIPEYLRIVTEQPRDWNTANLVGDLYARVGQMDKAVEQFVRIADGLSADGFLPKAAAVYKKILKLKPDHEHSLVRAAEIAAGQGLLVDARTYLNTVAERRRARGDKRGTAEITIRLGSLDPADVDARISAAVARVEIGDLPTAISDLKTIAGELAGQGRHAAAVEALHQAALLSPDDRDIQQRLIDVYVAAGEFLKARECATTADQLKALSAALDARGQIDQSLAALRDAARLEPDDRVLRVRLAKILLDRGDFSAAGEFLTAETAGNDPELLLAAAGIYLRTDRIDDGVALLRTLVGHSPARRDDIALLGCEIAAQTAEAGFRVVEIATEAAVAEANWTSAASVLQDFVGRVPNHIPALLRMVEICVDGSLEATMNTAQAQLADAYLEAGSAAEARFIAEDLVAREPWEEAHLERFRRALTALGEPDPDSVIAERLSGQSPFVSIDLFSGDEFPSFDAVPVPAQPNAEPGPEDAPAPIEPIQPSVESVAEASSSEDGPPRVQAIVEAALESSSFNARPPVEPVQAAEAAETFGTALFEQAVPLVAMIRDAERPDEALQEQDGIEIDLTMVLEALRVESQAPSQPVPVPASVDSSDLDGIFERLREEASRRWSAGAAEEHLKRGVALWRAGKIDESIQALQIASQSPRHRFETASLIGRLYRERDMMPEAIEWLERAAQAPAPTADEGHLLLYELADALERIGETARALTVSLELQSEAGDFRDLGARIDRLARLQTRG